jgi:acyl-[acyl-carrier-protein]-phospholipid O-acyltransferase / long-chain-fatty-acid--[acyl-carrier-protein] ligase
MFFDLLTTRRFAPLFWCQFFSAFNDNFLRSSLIFLILFELASANSEALIALAGAIFIFPFFILSGLGGELADRFDKAVIARRLKLVEIAVAIVAIAGFWMHSMHVLFAALFGFGVIAALFGPIKYGILPDHLAQSELPAGNALVEGATFVAILAGTIMGGMAAGEGNEQATFAAVILLFAVLCWATARLIPPTGRAAPDLALTPNILASTFTLLAALRSNPRLWWGGLVVSWFWLVGSVALALLPPLVKNVVGGTEDVVRVYLAIFSIAVALGAALASYLAAGRIVLRPTLIGGVLLGLFALDLGWVTFGIEPQSASLGIADAVLSVRGLRIAVDLAGFAAAGGLFIVPAFSAVQAWAGADRRARVIAAVNVLNAAFMTAAGITLAVLLKAGVSPSVLMLLIGVGNLAVAVAIARTMPDPQSSQP